MATSNALRAGHAFVEFMLKDGGVRKGLDRLEERFAKTGKALQTVGAVGLGISAAVAAPFVGAIKMASDAQETMSKFNVVFGENAEAMKSWGDNLAKTLGRSKTEVAGMLASFQDLLVPMGMTSDTAATTSQTLAQLAIDLGSFNNMADADVARDLAAALTGSGEVMKKYGVIVSEAAVKQELLNMKLDPATVTEAQKAQARLNIIMRGTTAAQGDAARTADGFANQMKALQAKLADTAVVIGEALLPVATELIGYLNTAALSTAEWISENEGLTQGLAVSAASMAALSAGVYVVGTAFQALAVAVNVASTAMTFLVAHPVVAAVVAIGATIGWLVYEFYKAHDAVTSFDEALKGLDGKRTLANSDAINAAILRYDQLAAKAKLSATEQLEAAEVMSTLRQEFGKELATGQANGRLTNVAKVKAQISAARQGKSIGLQGEAIAQARAARSTRIGEGATAEELTQRAEAIASMEVELERTRRIVNDAAPAAAMTPKTAAAVKTLNAGVDQSAALAAAASAPPTTAPLRDAWGPISQTEAELLAVARAQLEEQKNGNRKKIELPRAT